MKTMSALCNCPICPLKMINETSFHSLISGRLFPKHVHMSYSIIQSSISIKRFITYKAIPFTLSG